MSQQTSPPVGHPAPHRHRVAIPAQLAGVAVGPLAWVLQLSFGYSLTSYACHPGRIELSALAPGWGWTRPAGLAVNVLALLVCLAAALLSLRAWRATQDESGGSSPRLIDAGEGRTRFLAICGAMTSFGFAFATAFDTVMILGAPACRA